jgi:hypothetical protein
MVGSSFRLMNEVFALRGLGVHKNVVAAVGVAHVRTLTLRVLFEEELSGQVEHAFGECVHVAENVKWLWGQHIKLFRF